MGNFCRQMDYIRKNQMEIVEMKKKIIIRTIVIEKENALDGLLVNLSSHEKRVNLKKKITQILRNQRAYKNGRNRVISQTSVWRQLSRVQISTLLFNSFATLNNLHKFPMRQLNTSITEIAVIPYKVLVRTRWITACKTFNKYTSPHSKFQ